MPATPAPGRQRQETAASSRPGWSMEGVLGQSGLCSKTLPQKTVCVGLVVGKRDRRCSFAGRALANTQGLGLNPGIARARNSTEPEPHTEVLK